MSNQWGADVEALNTLGGQMEADGGTIEEIVNKVDGQLQQTWWQGPDRTSFDGEWDGHKTALLNAAKALTDAGGRAKQNAEAQRGASEAS